MKIPVKNNNHRTYKFDYKKQKDGTTRLQTQDYDCVSMTNEELVIYMEDLYSMRGWITDWIINAKDRLKEIY